MRRPAQPYASREAGFTLLELLVVMAVLAMAAVIALPLARGPAAGRVVEGTARDIAAMLRATRLSAISRNTPRAVTFDLAAGHYAADGVARARAFPPHVSFLITTAAGEQIGANRYRVRFFPDGSATDAKLSIGSGARHARIIVDGLTGRVVTRSGG